MSILEPTLRGKDSSKQTADPSVYWSIVLLIFCLAILFSNLGSAALFEPDEGRNAEIAREVLLLNDWVTPHYDFIPRLDKPIFFFDLVAFSYKLFGISEWSARLPSVLAALACLFLVYSFSRSLFGHWAALWSGLILLTSIEFFGLSRIVIMDGILTSFITVALCCFYLGQRGVECGKARVHFLLMYIAMGAATLTKGPIGFLLPASVIVFYLLVKKRSMLLCQMRLPLGISLFILTVAPWYLLAEFRNPGYLRYFLWEENVARLATNQFNRSGPWYYFIGVLAAGFFPWTVFLPATIANSWKRSIEGERLFLMLWIILPLFFFSFSSSKLPHYVLPIYPPLAIIVGVTIADALKNPSAKARWFLSCPIVAFWLLSAVPTLMVVWPDFLSLRLKDYVYATFPRPPILIVCGNLLAFLIALVFVRRRLWSKQVCLYSATALSFILMITVAEPIMATVSIARSSRLLAQKAAPFIGPDDQLILYDGYPSSLPFYLAIRRPIWVAWSGNKNVLLGSHYLARKWPEPASNYGKVLYTYEEFAGLWRTSEHRFVVFLDREGIDRLKLLVGVKPRMLVKVRDRFLVENKPVTDSRN